MDTSKITFIICLISISLTSAIESNKRLIRQKKKVAALKKPFRHQDRPSRQSNFDTSNDYSTITSESPNSWKPITYSVYTEGSENKPTEVNDIANSNIGHIDHGSDTDSSSSSPEEHNTDQLQDYTLLQYYIPFEQVISHAKPIQESLHDIPQKPISINKLTKAAVEPVTVFKKDDESHSSGENEFTGRYEYEYFVQDDHWGTNFGHKEYRDGKHTKGDYEVVLPDGRVQHVKYWSDASGYHASVSYHPLLKAFKHSA